ncbi:hypothetical protein NQ317_006470 [Molorchus minor]|uniref:Uncharacterized protein n=1 Tax=Molorchus minor TaxID=1323400 RepID=A0ABQ9J6Z7_9CUCU|nr:hypothetical protein NQ317_006470 [Molorchus minor]
MSKIEILPISKPLNVGTRIHWDEDLQCLYYVDVPNSLVYKYDINTGETTEAKVVKLNSHASDIRRYDHPKCILLVGRFKFNLAANNRTKVSTIFPMSDKLKLF